MRIPLGPLIVSIFAIVWVAAGTRSLPRKWFGLLLTSAVAISFLVVMACARWAKFPAVTFNAGAYEFWVAFEIVGIFLTVILARIAGRKDLILPVISLVVGIHFFGMVRALGSDLYAWVGGAICLLAALTLLLLPRSVWQVTVGIGCALILWLSALGAFF